MSDCRETDRQRRTRCTKLWARSTSQGTRLFYDPAPPGQDDFWDGYDWNDLAPNRNDPLAHHPYVAPTYEPPPQEAPTHGYLRYVEKRGYYANETLIQVVHPGVIKSDTLFKYRDDADQFVRALIAEAIAEDYWLHGPKYNRNTINAGPDPMNVARAASEWVSTLRYYKKEADERDLSVEQTIKLFKDARDRAYREAP